MIFSITTKYPQFLWWKTSELWRISGPHTPTAWWRSSCPTDRFRVLIQSEIIIKLLLNINQSSLNFKEIPQLHIKHSWINWNFGKKFLCISGRIGPFYTHFTQFKKSVENWPIFFIVILRSSINLRNMKRRHQCWTPGTRCLFFLTMKLQKSTSYRSNRSIEISGAFQSLSLVKVKL